MKCYLSYYFAQFVHAEQAQYFENKNKINFVVPILCDKNLKNRLFNRKNNKFVQK